MLVQNKIGLGISVMVVMALGGAIRANDIDDPSAVPPPHPGAPGERHSPSWQQTFDNGDGTFTFKQQVDEGSTPPHYLGPWYGGYGGTYGFEYYSWYDQDYFWRHDFPDHNLPGLMILSATLTIRAWDVDSETSHGYDGEFDGISGDGNWLDPQYLQGRNASWSVTVFNVNPAALADGVLNVDINIDMHHSYATWATTLDYSLLEIRYTFSGNRAPYAATLALSPVGCTYTTDDLKVAVTGPTPPDPDGDTVAYEYRWLVDTGTGFYVDDEFAGRGNHTGNTVPAGSTENGDRWKVQVTPVDQWGAHGTLNEVSFATIGQCNTPPIADAGGDRTSCTTSVTLDGTASVDPDGTITGYLWEYYDGAVWHVLGAGPIVNTDFGVEGVFPVRLTVTDDQDMSDSATVYITVDSTTCGPTIVGIDIWPFMSAAANTVYLRLPTRKVAVDILGSATFNVTQIDTTKLRFGKTGTEASLCTVPRMTDYNRDGVPDLMCEFRTGDCGFAAGDVVGILKGQLLDGTDIEGQDSVKIVP